MPSYRAPLAEYKFLLHDVLGIDEAVDAGTVDAVLAGAAKLAEQVWQPLNQSGDAEGCRFENGVVRAPAGFKAAFDAYYAGGWNTVSLNESWGGQGLPSVLALAVNEMMIAANLSLSTYTGLSAGVMGTLIGIAPDEIKALYVPKLVSGAWTGTMNLTEPHCGTDLRLMRTKAVRQQDGSYRITGTKIFITGGEHDMAENIVHLVLAKVLDEVPPEKADSLSAVRLFLVPKFLVNADGSLGPRNGVTCGGIESKMGLKGSATAVLHYEDAFGLRLDAPAAAKRQGGGKSGGGAGMGGMFNLMNAARLGVGFQGMALAEVAYQNAAAYARERLAGRGLDGAVHADRPADPIIVHPDVRRMLLTVRAFVEGARALSFWLSWEQALALRSRDPTRRQQAADLAGLLTPMIKAYFTDMGFECTNLALQCFGGHGYIREHGMEQFVRDARILQLYEGANGVQGLDLVGRRLPADGGRASRALFARLNRFIDEMTDDGDVGDLVPPLKDAVKRLFDATLWLAANAPRKRSEAGAAASDYLRLLALVMLGFIWLKLAKHAAEAGRRGGADEQLIAMKLTLARFTMSRLLPETLTLAARIPAGADTLMAPPAAAF